MKMGQPQHLGSKNSRCKKNSEWNWVKIIQRSPDCVICLNLKAFFSYTSVSKIPSRYILKRWTVDAKSNYSTGQGKDEVQSGSNSIMIYIRGHLKFFECGSLAHESYNVATVHLMKLQIIFWL